MDPPKPPPAQTTVSTTETLTTTTFVGGEKVRLMCSYGGHIIPRPHDKTLSYVGGETRIVSFDRTTSLSDLFTRLSKTLINGRRLGLKYQLPNEDLDSLITVTTDEDLDNMIDEYDRLMLLSSNSGRPGRIRLFLFPEKPDGPASVGPGGPDLVGFGYDGGFVDSISGLGLRRGFSDPVSVNCLLGLDNGVRDGGGGVVVRNLSNVEVQSVPYETTSSFGPTCSIPPMVNLAPIRVHFEDNRFRVLEVKDNGGRVSEVKVDGVRVSEAMDNGVRVLHAEAKDDGVRVSEAKEGKDNRARVSEVKVDVFRVSEMKVDGVRVSEVKDDGVRVSEAMVDVVRVLDGKVDGVRVLEAMDNGFRVLEANDDGVRVSEAKVDGVQVSDVKVDGVRVSEAMFSGVGGIEEQFGQFTVGVNNDDNNKQVDVGFVSFSSSPAPVVGPTVTVVPVVANGMVGNGSEFVMQTVGQPVNAEQVRQKQMGGGGGGELASPDSFASDNSFSNASSRQKPVTYQDSTTQVSNLNGHIQVPNPGYTFIPQYDPQLQQPPFHYQHQPPLQPPHNPPPPPSGAVPLSTFYQMYPHQQYQVYYVPIGGPPPYHLHAQQPPNVGEKVTTIPSSHPQPPQNPTLITTSNRVATVSGPQQYMGYSQIHHQSQSIAPNPAANTAYAYEFVDSGHPHVYYTRPPVAAHYQTVTSSANIDCSSPHANDNLKQLILSSQPLIAETILK